MGDTVVFRKTTRIIFPHACIGCGDDKAGDRLNYWVFHKPIFYHARKALAFAWDIVGTIGGAAHGGIVGGIVAHKVSNRTEKVHCRPAMLHTLYICNKCISKLLPDDHENLIGPSEVLFSENGITNKFFSLKITKGCVIMVLRNQDYSNALLESNHGVAFASLEKCIATDNALGEETSVYSKHPLQTPWINNERKQKYEQTYARKLSAAELAIADSWYVKISHQPSIDTYPKIAQRKLENAKASFGLTANESILGLMDSTALGSGKKGALFTLNAVYFKSSLGSTLKRFEFASLDPKDIIYKFTWWDRYVELSPGNRFVLPVQNDCGLVATSSFIWEAAIISRLNMCH